MVVHVSASWYSYSTPYTLFFLSCAVLSAGGGQRSRHSHRSLWSAERPHHRDRDRGWLRDRGRRIDEGWRLLQQQTRRPLGRLPNNRREEPHRRPRDKLHGHSSNISIRPRCVGRWMGHCCAVEGFWFGHYLVFLIVNSMVNRTSSFRGAKKYKQHKKVTVPCVWQTNVWYAYAWGSRGVMSRLTEKWFGTCINPYF